MHDASMSESHARLIALNAVLTVVARHSNLLQPMPFEELADAIERVSPFRLMAVVLPEATDHSRLYAISRGSSLPFSSFGARFPAIEAPFRRVFGEGRAFRCDDTRAGDELEKIAASEGFLSYLALPVRGAPPRTDRASFVPAPRGEALGDAGGRNVVAALLLGYGEVDAASAAPIELLQELADVVGESFGRSLQRSRERRLAMILDTSGDAMLAWSRDGFVTDVNGAAAALTGRPREELIGIPIRELLVPFAVVRSPEPGAATSEHAGVGSITARAGAQDPDAWWKSPTREARPSDACESRPEPQGFRMELTARGTSGAAERRPVSATVTAVEDDLLVAAHVLLRDLSQVVAAEREAAERLARIRELEEQHRNLLDNAPLIIFRLDPATGELSYLNRHAERLLGVPIAEALRTPGFLCDVHADPEGVMSFEDAVALARRGASSASYEARLRRRHGDAITARGTVYPLVSEGGRVAAVEGVLADVTAEHAARTRLVQVDRLSTLGTLAAGVAHEINNPAAFILLGLDMLDRLLRGPQVRMEGPAASSAAELLNELRDSIKRIVDIVRDLRLFASTPAPDGSRRTITDVNRTIESALSLARGQIIERAQIVKNLAEVPPILMDDGRLGQVMVNLLVNAAQAIPKPGSKQNTRDQSVTVETRSDGRTVEIEVRDTGTGISEENLQRIWTPFFTTKGPDVGTGLGLSISREIIERVGGRIRVESPVPGSDPPSGSRFVIELPAAGRAEEHTPVAAPLPRVVSRRMRVLVVEDEAALARALADRLGRVHQVTVAPSADAAMGVLAEGQRFDVVLCDLRMPGMSGEIFFARMRETDPALAARFIFMTGVGFGADVERFLASAGRPLLEKPFSAEAALECIAEVVTANRGEGKPSDG
jgi:PAS domain S-box-containing protein